MILGVLSTLAFASFESTDGRARQEAVELTAQAVDREMRALAALASADPRSSDVNGDGIEDDPSSPTGDSYLGSALEDTDTSNLTVTVDDTTSGDSLWDAAEFADPLGYCARLDFSTSHHEPGTVSS